MPTLMGAGYDDFNHHEPKAQTTKVRGEGGIHLPRIASAKKDDVSTQFYPRWTGSSAAWHRLK